MVRAWYFDDSDTDQRLEHKKLTNELIDMKEVYRRTLVSYWKLNFQTSETDAKIDLIKKKVGIIREDVFEVQQTDVEKFDQQLKIFYTEHLHPDHEIRLVVAGSGYFDVRDGTNDSWIRIAAEAGDLLVIPAGLYHRFTLDTKDYIKARLYFTSEQPWTAHNRPAEGLQVRQEYLANLQIRVGKDFVIMNITFKQNFNPTALSFLLILSQNTSLQL